MWGKRRKVFFHYFTIYNYWIIIKILTNLSTCEDGGGGGIFRPWDIVIMYYPRGFVEHVPD